MYTLDPLHPLFNAVIAVVAKQPGCTVQELHDTVRSVHSVDVSLQHIYRTVTRLVDAQILLKDHGGLRLNALWLSSVGLFIDQAQKQLSQSAEGEGAFPLPEGKRLKLMAETLLGLEAHWNHTLVQLYRLTGEKAVYKFYSHAWWAARQQPAESEYYRRIAEKGIACYWLYGNDTFLDRHAAKLNKGIFHSRIADRPPFPSEGYNLNVFGEYVLECIFPDTLAKHFSLLFKSVSSMQDFDPNVFASLFTMKGPYTMNVWRDPKRAAELRAKIARFF